jgi:3',5'-cyclic AMP phosphodiesterase CpdA
VIVTQIVHISDLHFGRPAANERLEALKELIADISPEAVAISGDLTQRCTNREFTRAKEYLREVEEIAPYVVIPGNHDIRWLGAVARNLGGAGLFRKKAHDFKYSRYIHHISEELSPSLEVPGAVVAGLNTAHGISRGSLTTRLRDLGVIGHVKKRDIEIARDAFDKSSPEAARIVMIHHNPIKGDSSGRHGLANTKQALSSFTSMGVELILCGHDHEEAVHTSEKTFPGLVISTAGTISNRLRAGRNSSFNLVEIEGDTLHLVTHTWQKKGFLPSAERSFPRRSGGIGKTANSE